MVTLDSSAAARSAGYSNTELAAWHLVSSGGHSLHGLILHSDQRTWDLFSHLERTLREERHGGAPGDQQEQPGDQVVSAETPPTQGQGRGQWAPRWFCPPEGQGQEGLLSTKTQVQPRTARTGGNSGSQCWVVTVTEGFLRCWGDVVLLSLPITPGVCQLPAAVSKHGGPGLVIKQKGFCAQGWDSRQVWEVEGPGQGRTGLVSCGPAGRQARAPDPAFSAGAPSWNRVGGQGSRMPST